MNNGPETNQNPEAASGDPQLEALLWHALRPEDPYTGFADRVLSRLADEQPSLPRSTTTSGGKLLAWPQTRLWITGAVAAALLVGLFEGEVAFRRAREQQRRIQQATEQFQTTERITVHALAQAREQLQRAGVPLSLD